MVLAHRQSVTWPLPILELMFNRYPPVLFSSFSWLLSTMLIFLKHFRMWLLSTVIPSTKQHLRINHPSILKSISILAFYLNNNSIWAKSGFFVFFHIKRLMESSIREIKKKLIIHTSRGTDQETLQKHGNLEGSNGYRIPSLETYLVWPRWPKNFITRSIILSKEIIEKLGLFRYQ